MRRAGTDRQAEFKHQVLLVIEGDIATTQLLERILGACKPIGVGYRKAYLGNLSLRHFAEGGLPLLVRCCDPELEPWIDLLKRAGRPYLYYLDDNFWEISGDSALARHYAQPRIRRCLDAAVTNARLILTNSDVLAAYVKRYNARVKVLPPFFDFDLIAGCKRESTDEIRIGFAGSQMRGGDLDLVRPIMQAVLDRIPGAVFEFAGAKPEGIEPGGRIRYFEHQSNYADYIRFQYGRSWAIGLAPLIDSASNRAKTNNKYREYGACGIAGVYSDLPPYRGSVRDGETGLIVGADAQEWFRAIVELAENSEFRHRVGRAAERDVRERYCVNRVSGDWGDCLGEVDEEFEERLWPLWRVYLGGTLARQLEYEIRQLWLQVLDAYGKGGVRMVASRTMARLLALVFANGVNRRAR